MARQSATVTAAWISSAAVVAAAVISGIFLLVQSDDHPSSTDQPQISSSGDSSPAVTVKDSESTTIIINPNTENTDGATDGADSAVLFIDGFVQILDHEIEHVGQAFTFDVSLRNPTKEPINISEVILRFDRELDAGKAFPASVEEISGLYVVQFDGDSSTAVGPSGKVPAYAWYPYLECQGLIVKAPVSQKLLSGTTDRFRVAVLFPPNARIRGPLDSVIVNVNYNGFEKT